MRRILLCLLLGCSAETGSGPGQQVSVVDDGPGFSLGEMCDQSSAAICQAWSACGILEPGRWPAAWGDPAECVAFMRAGCCPRGDLSCEGPAPAPQDRLTACLGEILAQSCEDLSHGVATPSCLPI